MADADVYDAILTTPVHDLRRAIVKACEANEQYRELTTKHLLIPADPNDSSTRKRKAFERCVNCRGTFEVLKNEDGDCVYHHGLKQVEFHNDFWADHDPDAHGEPETFKDDPDFQDGFVWSCCKGAGDAEGCVVTRHVAADDDDDRENKARKTSESEASEDGDEEEDHR
ncbi:hypothetical protein MBLNU230_g6065t1 [Neophaeotheca triangularis]